MDSRPSLNTCGSPTSPTAPQRAGNCRQRRLPNSGDANPGVRCVGGNIAAPQWRGSQVRAQPCSKPSDLAAWERPRYRCRSRTGIPIQPAPGQGSCACLSRSVSGLVRVGQSRGA